MTMKGVVACRIFIYMVIHNIPGMIISMNEYMSTYIYHSYMFKYISRDLLSTDLFDLFAKYFNG